MKLVAKQPRGFYFVLGALLTSCMFDVDANVIKSGPDASPPLSGDAGAGDDDADTDDGETPSTCPNEHCPGYCIEDTDCDAEAYCSLPLGSCAPRCDADRGCAGPRVVGMNSMLHDHLRVFWATGGTGTDAFGDPEPNGVIWAWDPDAEALEVATGVARPELLFVADDFIYFLDFHSLGARDLRRASLSAPSAPELVVESVQRAWKTEGFVYWSAKTGSAVELWRAPRSSPSAPERLALAQHEGWVAGNEEFVLHAEQRERQGQGLPFYLVSDQLTDLSVSTEVVTASFSFTQHNLCVASSFLYIEGERAAVERIDLSAPDRRERASPPAKSMAYFFEKDGWLYWSVDELKGAGLELTYGRTPAGPSTPAVLLTRVTADDESNLGRQFAVTDRQLVYWSESEARMFVVPLTPPP